MTELQQILGVITGGIGGGIALACLGNGLNGLWEKARQEFGRAWPLRAYMAFGGLWLLAIGLNDLFWNYSVSAWNLGIAIVFAVVGLSMAAQQVKRIHQKTKTQSG